MLHRLWTRNFIQFSCYTKKSLQTVPYAVKASTFGNIVFHKSHDQNPKHGASGWRGVLQQSSYLSNAAQSQPNLSLNIPKMTSASETENLLCVTWSDDNLTQFPFVWLRDNCLCHYCYHPGGGGRLLKLRDLVLDIRPQMTQITDNGEAIHIIWTDGHESVFPGPWLQERAFTKEAQKNRLKYYSSKKHMWGSDIKQKLPTSEFHDVITSDMALYNFLNTLTTYGLAIVQNTPLTRGQIKALSDRIAFQKMTHYGPTFRVHAKDDPSNVAYTTSELTMHTDIPYYNYAAGIQLLHCIVQHEGEGGYTHLVDGFRVAQQLKERDPDSYQMLTNTWMGFFDEGEDYRKYDKKTRWPAIIENKEGEVVQIRVNNMQRDSVIDTHSVDDVIALYKALKMFEEICYHPSNIVKMKMKPGDTVIVDNYRVLHGRQGFTDSPGNIRDFEGGYVDWDEINCTMRVLRKQLGIQELTE